MNVQGLGLETGKSIGDDDQFSAQGFQVLQSLVQAQILHPVYADFDSQEGVELLVQAAHQVLAAHAHHVMAMVEFFRAGCATCRVVVW